MKLGLDVVHRREYIVGIILSIFFYVALRENNDILWGIVFGLIVFFINISRLNTLKKSKWLSLLTFIPIANLGLVLYLIFVPEPDHKNEPKKDTDNS